MKFETRPISIKKQQLFARTGQWFRALKIGATGIIFIVLSGQLHAAEVIIDRPVRAGDLTVFPSVYDENNYFYLPDKPVLAINSSGVPKFSFMQYVRGQNEEQITGGGLVHAVVKLEVTDEQIREAEQELRQRRGGSARLVGPIPYRAGKVSLISSTINEAGDAEEHVVGLGSAPALENQEIAVAASIPKAGAEILYASMQTPAPDFTISFAMTIDGYNSPIQAKVVAEWDKIYKHQDIQAAIQTPVLAAELRATFENLRKTQVIKINKIGSDTDMDRAIETVYSLILKEAFDPIETTSPQDLLPSVSGNEDSLLDRAGKMMGAARKEAAEKKSQCLADNRSRASAPSRAAPTDKAKQPVGDAPQQVGEVPQTATKTSGKTAEVGTSDDSTKMAENSNTGSVDSEHSDYVKRVLNSKKELTEEEEKQKGYKIAKAEVEAEGGTLSNPPPPEVTEKQQKDCDEISMPVMAAVASYTLKKVRHSGRLELELNKATAVSFTTRFDLNMSGINRCSQCITQVNVDSPLNEPKDIQVSLGGEVGIEAFDSYLNAAEVRVRKTHQDGFVTNQSAVFTKASFSDSGNLIPIRYLWHNDNDRTEWSLYEYKVAWNLFGGIQQETEWMKSETDQIIITPPIKALLVDIDIPPSIAEQNGIMAVTLETKSSLGHQSSTTLNVFRNQLSKQHTVLVPRESPAYQYTMSWQTATGDQQFAPVETSSQVILVRPK